jgi:hypothetical protein
VECLKERIDEEIVIPKKDKEIRVMIDKEV